MPEIEQRDFIAQQKGGADLRRGDGGRGHGRRVWLNMVVRLALLPLPVQLTSLRGRRALVYWYRACFEEVPMRNLAFTILTVGIALAAGQARAQTYDPAVPVCMTRRRRKRRHLLRLLVLHDGPMSGVGCRPRSVVLPQSLLRRGAGVVATTRPALSPGRINIGRAGWGRTGQLLPAGAPLGLSRQLPILQLRPMHGHRERYRRLLRDQSASRVRAPAARRLSGPILSGSEAGVISEGIPH